MVHQTSSLPLVRV
jgi:hypothetical protein